MNKDILRQVGMDKEVKRVEMGRCPTCGKNIKALNSNGDYFRDEISVREWRISGVCQECQDSVFGGGE